MQAVEEINATAVPINRSNIDTDQIIPSDWLKKIERTGFDEGLFSQWRQAEDFILNNPNYSGAEIILAGENFGIGSSREHAIWAIQQYGFKAVISSKFGDIFKNNASKNGLVLVELPEDIVQKLIAEALHNPNLLFNISITQLSVNVADLGSLYDFSLSPSVQERLLNGLDDIDITLNYSKEISEFEIKRPQWL